MKFIYFSSLLALCLSSLQFGQSLECKKENNLSGRIEGFYNNQYALTDCWNITVHKDNYIRLNITKFEYNLIDCWEAYLKISVADTGEVYKFCAGNVNKEEITSLGDVNIESRLRGYYRDKRYIPSTFTILYSQESKICVQDDHFRCSDHLCIHQHQVCDRIKDCEDGSDEVGCDYRIKAIEGVNSSREDSIAWLKSQRSASFGWGRNTHRAVTALYLADATRFDGEVLEEELTIKEIELETLVALQRNSSVSELSMFVNALSAACHNPRKFYGHDLLQILSDGAASSKSPCPGAFLTLCNANWTFSESDVLSLLTLLHGNSEYLFIKDIQAMAVMALTCIKNKTQLFDTVENSTRIYSETIQKFIRGQHPDGSFGNVYTTAWVTQALLASGQITNGMWNMTSTVKYLMEHQNASADFLSTYLTLPIFNDKTLVDLAAVNCLRNRDKDDDISDVTDQLGRKIEVLYSLFIGDFKDVVHNIYLRVPENSSAYDVMRVAQVADPKYKFLHRKDAGQVYIYEIAGIINDPEALKVWLLYTGDSIDDDKLHHQTISPDKLILKDRQRLILWFKTVQI